MQVETSSCLALTPVGKTWWHPITAALISGIASKWHECEGDKFTYCAGKVVYKSPLRSPEGVMRHPVQGVLWHVLCNKSQIVFFWNMPSKPILTACCSKQQFSSMSHFICGKQNQSHTPSMGWSQRLVRCGALAWYSHRAAGPWRTCPRCESRGCVCR